MSVWEHQGRLFNPADFGEEMDSCGGDKLFDKEEVTYRSFGFPKITI